MLFAPDDCKIGKIFSGGRKQFRLKSFRAIVLVNQTLRLLYVRPT